ncbi:MAG TPA: carboxynorspermidine decarboxylase [Kofleriaceae bacterium]|nr:carboxynorspermidine decarboxylase [Kofleriaceae bacterium]
MTGASAVHAPPATRPLDIDVSGVETPVYIVDLGALRRNLAILADVQARGGCKVLLALKGFAMWSVFPLVGEYLSGIAASSLAEARLGREEMNKEVHVYAPAFAPDELADIVGLADHLVWNSFSQWERLGAAARAAGAARGVRFGMRVNPEHSEVEVALYDPAAPGSRLGVPRGQFRLDAMDGISGLHFHTLCELGADALERTLAAFEERFAPALERVEWVNFGGGHHITRPDYDVDRLVGLVQDFRRRRGVEVYLEPGEAVALGTGVLVASVLDIVHNQVDIALLDTSATAHMPDVLEMPYRPVIEGAGAPGEHAHTYRLGGLTCLAGDVIGDYSFPRPLAVGDKLVFRDMAHYTMVKNTTFNGVRLPSIALHDPADHSIRVVRRFGYHDYRARLS